MAVKKVFQELEFKDAFLFALTMEDEEICRGVLERILEIPVKKVKVRSENTLLVNSDYRGIRMDVFADDEAGTVFDVEMQTTDKGNLPKRSRYYQAQMDAGLLRPGEDFNLLPNSFVIFLCTFDPFGYGRWRYTFKERCLEDDENLGDGTCKVFLNTKGIHEELVTPELVRFLSYAGGEKLAEDGERTEDALIRQIDLRIASLKRNRRMEEQYMLFSEMLNDERKEGYEDGYKSGTEDGYKNGAADGRKKGVIEGEERLLALICRMQQEGLAAEIPRLHAEPEFLKDMYRRFRMEEKA